MSGGISGDDATWVAALVGVMGLLGSGVMVIFGAGKTSAMMKAADDRLATAIEALQGSVGTAIKAQACVTQVHLDNLVKRLDGQRDATERRHAENLQRLDRVDDRLDVADTDRKKIVESVGQLAVDVAGLKERRNNPRSNHP